MGIVWGPYTYTETDTVTSPGSSLITRASVLPIAIDGTLLPSNVNGLILVFTAGQIQADTNFNNFGDFQITVSTNATAFVGDTIIWDTGNGGGSLIPWANIVPAIALNPISDFTNPNPSGTWYLKFYGAEGATGVPVGLMNYTIELQSTAVAPAATAIDGPPAGNINPNTSLVFEATSGGSITTFIGTVTNSAGNTVQVYDNGFISPFAGSVVSITNGVQVTVHSPYGWPLGSLTLISSVTDNAPSVATASRTWTVVSGGGGGGGPIPTPSYINGGDNTILYRFTDNGKPVVN